MRNLAFAVLLSATFPSTACDTQTSQKMCSSEARTAVQGALTDEFGALVNPESVTVRVNDGHASTCTVEYGHYQCWEGGQRGGTYQVSVTSGGETMTAEVEVDADECHVAETGNLDFVIPGELQPCGFTCPDRRWLLAEVDLRGWTYLRVEDPRYLAPLPVVDGKLRVYAPSGLAMVEQTIPLRVSGGTGCTPGLEGIATLTLVPQSDGCGYQVASLQLATEEIDCRKP